MTANTFPQLARSFLIEASDEQIGRLNKEILAWWNTGVLDQEGAFASLANQIIEDTGTRPEDGFRALEQILIRETMTRFAEDHGKDRGASSVES